MESSIVYRGKKYYKGSDLCEKMGYSKANISKLASRVSDDCKIKLLTEPDSGNPKARSQKQWYFTGEGLKQIYRNSRKVKLKIEDYTLDELIHPNSHAKQSVFEVMLRKTIEIHLSSSIDSDTVFRNGDIYSDSLDFETEKMVGDYRLDFYFDKVGLWVEYDEPHHKYNIDNDKFREEKILDILNREKDNPVWRDNGSLISLVRVEQGREVEGLLRIVSELMRWYTY